MKKLLFAVVLAGAAIVTLSGVASYPSAVKSFTTRVAGDVIQPAHINDLQDEVTAIETDLLKTWTAVSFSAGNFTANGSMTWTVESGDVITFAYHKIGKRMTVSWYIQTTTVGGTVNTILKIAIPGGFTASKRMLSMVLTSDNGGATTVGYCEVVASSTTIDCYKEAGGNWTLSTNLTAVWGQITFETTT